MNRRKYLIATGTTAVLAGCLTGEEEPEEDRGDEESDEEEENGEETPEPDGPDEEGSGNEEQDDDHDALAVVDTYLRAAAEENFEAMDDATHTYFPVDFAEMAEDDDAYLDINPVDPSDVERKVIDEDLPADEIRDQPLVDFMFQEDDSSLEEVLDGEEAILVETQYEEADNGDTIERTDYFIMVTEDGEWTIFLSYEEPVDVPDAEPVTDDEYDIVDDIEYDPDDEIASVNVSGAEDVEADKIIGYSASLEEDASFWAEDSETLPRVNHFSVPFDPDGDEIVVTLLLDEDDDEEIVIYRDEYIPEEAE